MYKRYKDIKDITLVPTATVADIYSCNGQYIQWAMVYVLPTKCVCTLFKQQARSLAGLYDGLFLAIHKAVRLIVYISQLQSYFHRSVCGNRKEHDRLHSCHAHVRRALKEPREEVQSW